MPRRSRSSRPPRRRPAAAPVVETTVFRSGNSDAIRLPARFGFRGQRVYLRRLPDGRVVIEPKRKRRWPVGFLASFGRATPDFESPERPLAEADADARAPALFDEGGERE